MYKYVLAPMNDRLINLVPMNMAPNLLTLMGLAIMSSAHILTYAHSPNFDQALPPWLCFYCAVSFYLYQVCVRITAEPVLSETEP
jgi:ethanolaminephosphotransferase